MKSTILATIALAVLVVTVALPFYWNGVTWRDLFVKDGTEAARQVGAKLSRISYYRLEPEQRQTLRALGVTFFVLSVGAVLMLGR